MSELCSSFDTRDDFNRKSIAEKLIRLLTSNNIDISPMVIDGGWGIGKSEFCLKTINLIKSEYPDEYHVVYIDAFKTDYTGEPVLALLGEIINTCCPEQGVRENFINKMGNAAGFLLKTTLKTAVSYVVRENAEDLKEEFSDAIKGTSNIIIDNAVSSLLKDQVEAEKNIKILQDTLREISNNKQIIIFVDELDRCRPDYAIDMLEVIKHVFNIDNIKIVLVTNMEQLKLSISHRYGIVHNSQRYLDKFIKFSLRLPSKLNHYSGSQSNAYEYFYSLSITTATFKLLDLYSDDMKNLIKLLIDEHKVSLKEVESICRLLDIFLLFYHKGFNYLSRRIILLCVFMAIIKPKLISDFINNSVDADDLARFLGIKSQVITQNADSHEWLFLLSLNHTNINREKYQLPDFERAYWVDVKSWMLTTHRFDISYSSSENQKPFGLFNSIIDTLSLCSV